MVNVVVALLAPAKVTPSLALVQFLNFRPSIVAAFMATDVPGV
jgi:hypothetical protein